jgi:hypothetical protein
LCLEGGFAVSTYLEQRLPYPKRAQTAGCCGLPFV